MNYTIFNRETGEICKNISCSQSTILLQYDSEICSHIEGDFDYFKFYVKDRKAVEIPAAPSAYHSFDFVSKQWIDLRTVETEWELIRSERNKRLAETDWTQLPDVPLHTRETWMSYRQALRDVTNQSNPFTIEWPVKPS